MRSKSQGFPQSLFILNQCILKMKIIFTYLAVKYAAALGRFRSKRARQLIQCNIRRELIEAAVISGRRKGTCM